MHAVICAQKVLIIQETNGLWATRRERKLGDGDRAGEGGNSVFCFCCFTFDHVTVVLIQKIDWKKNKTR